MAPLAFGLSVVSTAASSLSRIPMLSSIMKPLAWATRVSSNVASVFGWSKPRVNDTPHIIAQQNFRYIGTSDGPDVSFPLTVYQDNAIKMTDDFSLTSEDEMSFKYLLSVPYYNGGVTSWTTGITSGTQLYIQAISPSALFTQTSIVRGLRTITFATGSPMYYLSQAFSMYRGSIKVKFKIAKTIYHSGKLLVTFTPVLNEAVPTTVLNSIYSLREIVDIREKSEFEFTLPYMLNQSYVETGQSLGYLRVHVLNDLRCPETCAQYVDLLAFYTAGEDFEYQVPGNKEDALLNVFTPQMSKEVLVKEVIGNLSSRGLDVKEAERCIGENVLSVKQLINRNMSIQVSTTNIQVPNLTTTTWFPWYIVGHTNNVTTGVDQSENVVTDAYSFFAPMFLFYRGKARMLNNINSVQSTLQPYALRNISSTSFFNSSNTTSIAGIGSLLSTNARLTNAFQTTLPGSNVAPFVQVPYYSKFPASFVQVWQNDAKTYFNTDKTLPVTNIVFGSGTSGPSTNNGLLQRSFSDDFQLSFFISCPHLLISNALT